MYRVTGAPPGRDVGTPAVTPLPDRDARSPRSKIQSSRSGRKLPSGKGPFQSSTFDRNVIFPPETAKFKSAVPVGSHFHSSFPFPVQEMFQNQISGLLS